MDPVDTERKMSVSTMSTGDGPEKRHSFNDGPVILELASNTILTFVVSLSSFKTGRCVNNELSRCHLFFSDSSSEIFSIML